MRERQTAVRRDTGATYVLGRREFLRSASAMAAGAVLLGADAAEAQVPAAGKMPTRRMGRTNLQVSVMVAGEYPDPAMHERAFEVGINYWHRMDVICDPYGEFAAHSAACKPVFTKRDRDSFYCDAIIDTLDKDGAIAQFEWALKCTGFKMIDFLKVHSTYERPEDIKRKPGVLQAFDELKKQGKVRFLALASHGQLTAEICTAACESGYFDQIQPVFQIISPASSRQMLAAAQKNDVGVIAKKIMCGGLPRWQREPNVRAQIERAVQTNVNLPQAIIKWTLAQPGVTCVIPLCRSIEELNQNAAACLEPLTATEREVLGHFADALGTTACRFCGTCAGHCPQAIPVHDIQRYKMYCEDYGEAARARRLYAALPAEANGGACTGCGECTRHCPYGLPAAERVAQAHALLS